MKIHEDQQGQRTEQEVFSGLFQAPYGRFSLRCEDVKRMAEEMLFRGNLDAYGEETNQNFALAYQELIKLKT